MKVFYSLILSSLFISSCEKAVCKEEALSVQAAAIKIRNGYNNPLYEEAKRYTAYSCKTANNKAGIICEGTKGDCKAQASTPIDSTAYTGLSFSIQEAEAISIRYATQMVASGKYSAAGYNDLKSFTKRLLLENKGQRHIK